MARQLQWTEKTAGFSVLSTQGGVELISAADMDEIRACTVERIVMTRYTKNGSTAQNEVHEGIIVAQGEASVTDYLDPKDEANANSGWLWKDYTAYDTADARRHSYTGVAQSVDIRVRRKMKQGQVLQYLIDDTANDYDLIGLTARVLIRLA